MFLVCHTPDDIGGALLAAHRALAGGAGLCQGHATGGNADLLLHGQLAIQFAAPLGVNETAVVLLNESLDLFPGLGSIAVVLQVLFSHGEHVVVDLIKQALNGLLQFSQGDEELLTGIAAGDAALLLLHILGTDLYTQRHAAHFVLGILPASCHWEIFKTFKSEK